MLDSPIYLHQYPVLLIVIFVRTGSKFTISSVVCGVHRRTSSDWGKGLSPSWLYTANTVLYISPTIINVHWWFESR